MARELPAASRIGTTHTYAVLEVSPEAYKEIRAALSAAGYEHAFGESTHDVVRGGERLGTIRYEVIDMHGIALAERQ